MKKRVLFLSIAAVILCLLAWRLYPRPFSGISPVDTDSITKISGYLGISGVENGEARIDSYELDSTQLPEEALEELLTILNSTRYQPDFRNLLPWGVDSLGGGKHSDGRTVNLYLFRENDAFSVGFLSIGNLYVDNGAAPGFRIYHPTNREMFDDLVEYCQTYGKE